MKKIDLNQTASSRELILFTLFVAVFLLAFFRGIYLAKLEQIRQGRDRTDALVMERDALARFMKVSLSIAEQPRKPGIQDEKLEVLTGKRPSPFADVPALLSSLTEPVLLGGVRMEGFSYQTPTVESGFSRTDFVLHASGGFDQLVGYLEKLEKFPALFQVRDLVLSTAEDKGNLHAEITCRFYKKLGGPTES